MDQSNPEISQVTQVKPVKKVFTSANKSKIANEAKTATKNIEIEVIEKEAVAKTKKPKKPKEESESVANLVSEAAENTEKAPPVAEKKKKPRKRGSKKKKSETDGTGELCKEIKEISLTNSLSAEAAPFVPDEVAKTNSSGSKKESNNKGKNKDIKSKDSKDNVTANSTTATANNSNKRIVTTRKPVSRPKPKEEDLRKVEVNQLQIRFAPTGFTISNDSSDDSITMQCVLPITDPEFSYDLETVRIEIILPRDYPGTKTAPIRPFFSILNSDIPSAITARIERNLKWGLNSLEGGILVCRPMLRYLEDNLEKWMVDDVRESAFKFVKPSEIKVTEKPKNETDDSDSEDDDSNNAHGEATAKPQSTLQTTSSSSRISKGDWLAPPPVTDQSAVGGNPFTLKLYFSTIRGIDLLTSQRLTFLASCDRCKFNFPVEDLRPFVDRIEHCPKCTNQTKFCYKAQLVTPGANFEDDDEYEAILGSIRFLRAKPVDLLPSLYQCACSRCYGSEDNNDGSSSCKIEKVKIGENISYSCFNCHQKIRFQIDRIEWISEATVGAATSASQKQQNRAAAKNGPVLSVGTPLPQNGTCEHYKKSFRWYRFPCCGQAFPCDECHAKDPVAKDHPVEWATRFICGFCSREQSISVKECPECGKDTSAAGRKFTSFWEGGKGTRNQVLMNRKDSKKYKNYSTNSASAIKTKPKPKNTSTSS